MEKEYEKTGQTEGATEAGNQDISGVLVSVCCLSFNHERYLRQALDSFLGQERDFGIEILIHDDASTDSSADIIREYEEKYPDIVKPVYQTENQYSKGISNISGVFNFPRASGKYIAMCEGDDFWCDKEKLRLQVEIMEAHPEYALCAHSAGIISEDGAFRSESRIEPFRGTREISPEELIAKKTNLPTASLFFRTEYAKRLPKWYFDCPVGDIPLQLFMIENGGCWYIDRVMSMYRMGRAGSWGELMDAGERERQRAAWEKHYSAMKSLYEAFDRDTGGRWHEAAEDALKRQRFHIDLKEEKPEAVTDPGNRRYLSELAPAEQRLLQLKVRHRWLYDLLRKTYLLFKKKR